MERGSGKKSHRTIINHHQEEKRERIQQGIGDSFRPISSSKDLTSPPTPDFVLQWGHKKRLRCTKILSKDEPSNPAQRTTARVDRRVIRTAIDSDFAKQRPSSPPHRVLGNSENMRQGHSNIGGAEYVKVHIQEGKRGSPASASINRKNRQKNDDDDDDVEGGSFEKALEEGNMKGGEGGGSSSGSEVIPPAVWPPKFVIALTNKEKEEDFMAIKVQSYLCDPGRDLSTFNATSSL